MEKKSISKQLIETEKLIQEVHKELKSVEGLDMYNIAHVFADELRNEVCKTICRKYREDRFPRKATEDDGEED